MEIKSTTFLEKNSENLKKTLNLFQDKNLSSDTFCIMPFVNITLEPNGNVGICRHKGSEYTFGNIRNKSIDDIWESKEIQSWRQEHITGKTTTCHIELNDCRCNLCPELNKLLPHAEINNIKNPKILRLTANLNGQCNLKCQMCDIWKLPNGFYNEENFWKPAREKFFKHIMEVDMLSGEPFIQKDTYRLIDEISCVNPACSWSFTSNLHWQLNEYITDHLDKISIKYFLISLDSLNPDIYNKIRYPGNLDFVLKNIQTLLLYQKSRLDRGLGELNIRINFLVQKDNWQEVKDIINYCLKLEITPFLTFLYAPHPFSLLDLDYQKKIEILNFYYDNLTREELLFTQRIIKPLLRSLNKIDYIYYLHKLQLLAFQ